MDNLFSYGTLMCEDIMEEVSGFRLSHAPGTLKGYSRRSVRNELYPAIFVNAGGCVDGVVYRDVPLSAWVRLDRFEGEMYERRHVKVAQKNGMTLPALAYVVRETSLDLLEDREWEFDHFLRNGKENFRKHYPGYPLKP